MVVVVSSGLEFDFGVLVVWIRFFRGGLGGGSLGNGDLSSGNGSLGDGCGSSAVWF